jgi:hypothetical protein
MLLLSSLLLLISVVTAAVCVTAASSLVKHAELAQKIFFSAGSACVGDFLAQAQPAQAIF